MAVVAVVSVCMEPAPLVCCSLACTLMSALKADEYERVKVVKFGNAIMTGLYNFFSHAGYDGVRLEIPYTTCIEPEPGEAARREDGVSVANCE